MATNPTNMALFPSTTDAGNNGILQNIVWQGHNVPAYGTIDQATGQFLVHHIPADTDFEMCEPDGVIIGTVDSIKNDRLLQLLSKDPDTQFGIVAKIAAAHGNGVLSQASIAARVGQAFIWMKDQLGLPDVAHVRVMFNIARRKNGRNAAGGSATRITWVNEGLND